MKCLLLTSFLFLTSVSMAQQDLSAILKQTLLSNADFTEKINSLINTYSGEIVAETAVDVIIDLNKTAATETFFDNILQ
jgi:hypothetical protein